LALVVVSVALVVALGASVEADRRAAEVVRGRGVEVQGTVVSAVGSGSRRRADVRFETASGTITVRTPIEPSTIDVGDAVVLVYDPADPSEVWAPGGTPSVVSDWWAPLFISWWLPLGAAIGLWTRWHPPNLEVGHGEPVPRRTP
jgi:hypothetical protein